MKSITHLALAGLLTLSIMPAHAGLTTGKLRYVFQGEKKELVVKLKNTGAVPLLATSTLAFSQGQSLSQTSGGATGEPIPFMLTPSVMKINAGREAQIHIISNHQELLPQDRESLLTLSIGERPADLAPDELNLPPSATQSHYRIFYRPEGLHGKSIEAYQQLAMTRDGQEVEVANPTPFFVTLLDISVNDHRIAAAGLIPPFGHKKMAWCPEGGECRVIWHSVNESGGSTENWGANLATGVTQNGEAWYSDRTQHG